MRQDPTKATYYEDSSGALLGCYEVFATHKNQFTADQFILANGYSLFPFKVTTTRVDNGVKIVDARNGQTQLELKIPKMFEDEYIIRAHAYFSNHMELVEGSTVILDYEG